MKKWREGVNHWHLFYDVDTGKIVGRVGYNNYDDTAIAKFNDEDLGEYISLEHAKEAVEAQNYYEQHGYVK